MKNESLGILVKSFLPLFMLSGILIFTFPRLVIAQSQNIRFEHPTRNEGLSQNLVHFDYQDKNGIIWIGTENGLNWYIGVNQTDLTMSTDREKRPYEFTVVQDITMRKGMETRIRKDIREKEMLLKVNHHRAKNNMQIIVSLLGMQSEQLTDADVYWSQST